VSVQHSADVIGDFDQMQCSAFRYSTYFASSLSVAEAIMASSGWKIFVTSVPCDAVALLRLQAVTCTPRLTGFRTMHAEETIGLVLCLFVALWHSEPSAAEDPFAIRDGDTVAFLGDSITAARTYGKLIENFTLLRYPNRKVRFINAGVGGDTAAGGLKRLERDVFKHKVTLLTVAYGINDIGWGLHANDEHRQAYLDAIRGIVAACRERGVKVYICSAAVTGQDPSESEESFLQKMCDEGMAIAEDGGEHFIDVQRTMREIQKKVRKSNEDTNDAKKKKVTMHAADGIHLSELGQLSMAFAILKGLGATDQVSSATLDAEAESIVETIGCRIADVERTNDGLEFTRTDDRLPFNNGIFYSLHYRFVPVPQQLNRYMLCVKNLAPGRYRLTVSERNVGAYSAKQLATGVNIASATGNVWQSGGPWDAQASVLKSLTDSRHNLAVARRLSHAWIKNPTPRESLWRQATMVSGRLEQMQREAARPRPYDFVLTRAENGKPAGQE
jgi:lysophospholipase L1-like esterase